MFWNCLRDLQHEHMVRDKENNLIIKVKIENHTHWNIFQPEQASLWGELQVYTDGQQRSGQAQFGAFFSSVKWPSSFGNKGEEIRREIWDSWDWAVGNKRGEGSILGCYPGSLFAAPNVPVPLMRRAHMTDYQHKCCSRKSWHMERSKHTTVGYIRVCVGQCVVCRKRETDGIR